VIAKQSREGWFQSALPQGFALEPPRRFAPPLLTQEGERFPEEIQLIWHKDLGN